MAFLLQIMLRKVVLAYVFLWVVLSSGGIVTDHGSEVLLGGYRMAQSVNLVRLFEPRHVLTLVITPFIEECARVRAGGDAREVVATHVNMVRVARRPVFHRTVLFFKSPGPSFCVLFNSQTRLSSRSVIWVYFVTPILFQAQRV